jgi:nucleotide-binding universal stress UspA family protein
MKSYRRILVPVLAGQAIDPLARRATALAGPGAEVRVVAIMDTASGFEPDGPAAVTAAERAARKRPAVLRRLELELARGPLAGAAAQVLSGEPGRILQDLLRDWRPDLVVAQDGLLPSSWLLGAAETPLPDVLKIARPPRLTQLLGMVLPRTVAQS